MKRCLCLFFGLLVTIAAISDPSDAQQPDIREDVQNLLETFQDDFGFPGATDAYAVDGGLVETVAVGFADAQAGIPMVPESRLLAASIGKTIWGALVLSLEANGTLSRSDLVSNYLGHLPWRGGRENLNS